MTHAAKSPVTRVVEGASGQEYVVTVTAERLVIRPKRSRQVDARVDLGWDSIYQRALLARVSRPVKPQRKVSRGLLTTAGRAAT